MVTSSTIEKLQRGIYREFMLEEGLLAEVGLEEVPSRLASMLDCSAGEAIAKLVSSPMLEDLSLEDLGSLLIIRDMTFVSRTAAAVAADLKKENATYEECCRTAICYAVIGSNGHAFSALRAAAAKNDAWARHHYLYGLILGLEGNLERARWELGIALQYEPYEEGRVRIRRVMDILDAD